MSDNLLENPGFEADWSEESSHRVIMFNRVTGEVTDTVAGNVFAFPKWIVWSRIGGEYNLVEVKDAHKSVDAVRVHSGEKAAQFFKTDGIIDCGLMQRVYVGKGSTVRGGVFGQCWSMVREVKDSHPECYGNAHCSAGVGMGGHLLFDEDIPPLNGDPWNDAIGNEFMLVGIDPYGRLDPYAEGVVWGKRAYSYNEHHELPPAECEAQDDYVTFILRAKNKWRSRNCDAYWDDAELVIVNEPVPPPAPGKCRGHPRVQYERVYLLLPPGAGEDWAMAAVRGTWDVARITIGASADDAGVADLNVRKVIVVNPRAWDNDGNTIEGFYPEYYPSVQAIYITATDPDDLETQLKEMFPESPTPPPTPTTASKIGPHVLRSASGVGEFLAAKPACAMLVGDYGLAPNVPDGVLAIGALSGLGYDAQHQYHSGMSPADAALQFMQDARPTIDANPSITYWQGHNEPVWNSLEEMSWYASFEIKRMQMMADLGKRCVIGSFATGTPPLELWSAFIPACQAALQAKAVLGLHEYSCPWTWWMTGKYQMDPDEDQGDEGWTTLRYRKVYRQYLVPAGVGNLPLVITETGIDPLVNPKPEGAPSGTWKQLADYWREHDNEPDNADYYYRQLLWYETELRKDDYVVGACVFTCGNYGSPWDKFDIAGTPVIEKLTQYVQDNPAGSFVYPGGGTPPPPIPTGTLIGLNDPDDQGAGQWMLEENVHGILYVPVILNFTAKELDFTRFASQGIEVYVNLRYDWASADGGQGTLPLFTDQHLFEQSCVQTIKDSVGVHGWSLTNEANSPREWPKRSDGTLEAITVARLATFFDRVAEQVPDVRLSLGGFDPFNVQSGMDPREWTRLVWQYMDRQPSYVDVHGYIRGPHANLVGSLDKFPPGQLDWQYLNYPGCFTTLLEVLPTWAKELPIVVSEFNHLYRTVEGDNGWVNDERAADVVGAAVSLAGGIGLHGLVIYRWAGDDWAVQNNEFVKQAVKIHARK